MRHALNASVPFFQEHQARARCPRTSLAAYTPPRPTRGNTTDGVSHRNRQIVCSCCVSCSEQTILENGIEFSIGVQYILRKITSYFNGVAKQKHSRVFCFCRGRFFQREKQSRRKVPADDFSQRSQKNRLAKLYLGVYENIQGVHTPKAII